MYPRYHNIVEGLKLSFFNYFSDSKVVRVIGGMIPDPPWPARYECARWLHVNLGDVESYPPIKDMLKRLLSEFSTIVIGHSVPGMMTSGATESNILALYYWKKQGRKRVLLFSHTHYSIIKAAQLLDLEYKIVKKTSRLSDVSEDDIIVATLGTTEEGLVDDLKQLREIASKTGAVIHIDAAYYGPLYRYNAKSDLILDELSPTISVDLHKIPESPPPAGVLFSYNNDIIESLYFSAPYIPNKRQFGVLGTRPGCVVPAALAALELTIVKWPGGPSSLLSDLNKIINIFKEELSKYGYEFLGGPAPIRCILHPRGPWIIKWLRDHNYYPYTCRNDKGIRFAAMPHYLWKGFNWIIEVLKRAAGATGK